MRFRQRVAAKLQDLAWGGALFASSEAIRRVRPGFALPPGGAQAVLLNTEALGADIGLFRATWPERVGPRLARADRICNLDLETPGEPSPRVRTSHRGLPRALWHTDPGSNHGWRRRSTSSFLRIVGPPGSDVLRSWKLSRMQHLVALGQAHVLSPRPRYAEAFKKQVTDWIAANPVGHGVNWISSMEAGIRAGSWLIAHEHFLTCDRIRHDTRFLRRLYGSLRDHARFLRLRMRLQLERGRAGSNHHVVAAAGLFLIASSCGFLRGSASWRAFATERLLASARDQVLPDGWDFEASTSYHRLVLESYVSALLIAERVGVADLQPLAPIVRRMCDAVRDSVKDDATTPQIGDNDGTRFLRLRERASLDRGYLLSIASILFRDPTYRLPGVDPDEDVFWLFGARGLRQWEAHGPGSRAPAAVTFPDAGWHVIRTDDVHAFVACRPDAADGFGGHAHNDKLSVVLRMAGRDILVDPGSPDYGGDPEARNLYRSTRWHNTFAAEGCEQNLITSDLFFLEDRARVDESRLVEEATRVVFHGGIRYGDVIHRRVVTVHRREPVVRIEDRIEQTTRAGGVVSFHLAPGIGYRDGYLVDDSTDARIARFDIRGDEVRVETYEYAPTHGVRQGARRVVVVVPSELHEARVEVEFRAC